MKLINIIMLLITFQSFGQQQPKTDSLGKRTAVRFFSNKIPEPLYVIDRKIITAEEFKKLKPETIESITILKNDTVQFSSEKRNVIVIKTKKISKRELRKMKKKNSLSSMLGVD